MHCGGGADYKANLGLINNWRERESYEISFIISLRGIKQMIDKVATVHPNYKKMDTFLEQKLIFHSLIFLEIKYFLIHNTENIIGIVYNTNHNDSVLSG